MRRINSRPLGELLLNRGIVSQSQLDKALVVQKKEGGLIGAILVEMGLVKEGDIAQVMTAQYGVPYLPLKNYRVDKDIAGIIPGRVARQYLLVPLDKNGNSLSVAMSNPFPPPPT